MPERGEPGARAGQPTTGLLAASEARVVAELGPSPPPCKRFATRLRGGLPRGLPEGFGEALRLFVTLRAALSLFALVASLLFQLPGPCAWENGPRLHTAGLDFRLLGVWQRWDACWYEKVATFGYPPRDASVNFYPLYPLLMRAVSIPLAGNLALSGLAVSGAAYIAAMIGLYRLVSRDFDGVIAARAMLYLSVFPAAFFLFVPYTEALFLALAVWALYTARQGRWGWAAVIGFLIGLSRTPGCLVALPLAWEAFRQWRRPGGGRRLFPALLVGTLPIASFLLYLAYTKAATGWTPFDAGRTIWVNKPQLPWVVLSASWRHVWQRGDALEALNLGGMLIFIVVLVVGLRRLPLSYTLYAAPQLLLYAGHTRFLSPLSANTRYLLIVFPVFVLLALLFQQRRPHYSWLILSLLLLAFLLYAFLSGPYVA